VYATGFDATSMGDPGIVAISTLDGSVRTIIKPAVPDDAVSVVARNVLVSPSGRTVLSAVCVPSGCTGGTIIDAASGRVTGTLTTTEGPSAINDTYALVRGGGDVTTAIALVSLESGKVAWRRHADEIYHAYVTDGDEVVTMTSRDGHASLDTIALSGAVRSFTDLSGHLPTLWDTLSSNGPAVLGDGGPFPGNAGGDGMVRADVLDLETQAISRDAFQLDLDGQP
jgi:hypothetical protein